MNPELLKCWTQQRIAEEVGVGVATVNELIQKFEIGNIAEIEKFKPFLYNIWNTKEMVSSLKTLLLIYKRIEKDGGDVEGSRKKGWINAIGLTKYILGRSEVSLATLENQD